MSISGDVAALLFLMASCLSGSSEALTQMKDIECYSNVSLPCYAGQLGPRFRSLTWFMIPPLTSNQTGILWRRGNKTTMHKSSPRPATLGPEGQLILPRVTPNDTGTYECLLRANIGGQNLESSIYLSVNACIEQISQESPLLEELVVHAGWGTLCVICLGLLKSIICVVAIKVLAKMRPF